MFDFLIFFYAAIQNHEKKISKIHTIKEKPQTSLRSKWR